MELKQSLKLSQQLVMTPQLQQAIRLLQLSRLELLDEVRKELDGNPILSDDVEPDPRERNGQAKLDRLEHREEHQRSATDHQQQEKAAKEVDWEKFLENRTQQQPTPQNRGGFDELPPVDQNLTRAESLQEHLLWQLQLGDFTDVERAFGEL